MVTRVRSGHILRRLCALCWVGIMYYSILVPALIVLLWLITLRLVWIILASDKVTQLEAAVTSFALICAIVVMTFTTAAATWTEPAVTQSSPPTNNVTSLNGVRLDPDYAGTQVVIYDKIFKVPMDMTPEAQQAYINLIAAREWAIRHPE